MTFVAKGFNVSYGNNIAAPALDAIGDYLLVTAPEPWEFLRDKVSNKPVQIIQSGDLSPEHLDHLAETSPAVTVVGLGGGSAMDTAKWIHWRRSLPLMQLPSLPSVDACFTRMSALRDRGGVRYEGDAIPDMVNVDFELFRAAPRAMVTSGIGDVLSCHTAWFDWKFAFENDQDEFGWSADKADISHAYLNELYECADGIKNLTDDGLRRLMELHRDIGRRCHDMSHARFEEGSEHFFAYTFEEVTGRTILHGELVSMGVQIMSHFQGNNPERVREIIARAGTRHKLADLGISMAEVMETMRRLPTFTVEQKHWYSYARTLDPAKYDEQEIKNLLDW
jgi:glycerol dehydrogenase-like iron-containing ADH family enzyme